MAALPSVTPDLDHNSPTSQGTRWGAATCGGAGVGAYRRLDGSFLGRARPLEAARRIAPPCRELKGAEGAPPVLLLSPCLPPALLPPPRTPPAFHPGPGSCILRAAHTRGLPGLASRGPELPSSVLCPPWWRMPVIQALRISVHSKPACCVDILKTPKKPSEKSPYLNQKGEGA